MAAASKAVVVAAGARHDLKQVQALVASVLKHGGCPACLSGFDIHLMNEVEFFTHNVNISTKQLHVEGG